jgi:hypothetical protein
MTERCERRHTNFRHLLDNAGRACSRQDRDAAEREIAAAIGIETQQKDDLKHLRHAEKKLLSLTKIKLKKEK